MKMKSTDLISLFEQALTQKPTKKLDEIGIVLQVGEISLCIYAHFCPLQNNGPEQACGRLKLHPRPLQLPVTHRICTTS